MFGKRTRSSEPAPEWVEIVVEPVVEKIKEGPDAHLALWLRKGERRGCTHIAYAPDLLGKLGESSAVSLLDYSPGSGTLRVHLAGGPVVEVPPLPNIEAWDVEGVTNVDLYCMPGGQVASFTWPLTRTQTVKVWFQNLFSR